MSDQQNSQNPEQNADTSARVKALVMPGNALRLFYGPGNLNNKKMHIRAIVDDEYVVFRHWRRSKKSWAYQVEHIYFFKINLKYLSKA